MPASRVTCELRAPPEESVQAGPSAEGKPQVKYLPHPFEQRSITTDFDAASVNFPCADLLERVRALMIFIDGMDEPSLPRWVTPSLESRLRVMSTVVVTGARQTGKSTLVQAPAPGRRRDLSPDDLDVVDAARRDPEVLVVAMSR
jgi:hypothetical protein